MRTRRLHLVRPDSVVAQKKKIIVLLAAVALTCGGLVLHSAQSVTKEAKPEDSAFEMGSLFASDPNFSDGTTGPPGSGEFFSKMMLSVLIVMGLGAAALYISKKWLPRLTNLPTKEIRILETAYLGPRKAVHLVKIGQQRLLIGSTNESITMLADVTDGLPLAEDAFADLAARDDIDGCAR
jgi:flagellar biosynthetic protein FliO